jgi:hypothetical protein
MAGMTIAKATIQSAKVSDNFLGIYLKPFVNLSGDTMAFARVGYASHSGKSEKPSGNFTWSTSNPSYGVGLQTQFTKDVYGAIDYMDYGKASLSGSYGAAPSNTPASPYLSACASKP